MNCPSYRDLIGGTQVFTNISGFAYTLQGVEVSLGGTKVFHLFARIHLTVVRFSCKLCIDKQPTRSEKNEKPSKQTKKDFS